MVVKANDGDGAALKETEFTYIRRGNDETALGPPRAKRVMQPRNKRRNDWKHGPLASALHGLPCVASRCFALPSLHLLLPPHHTTTANISHPLPSSPSQRLSLLSVRPLSAIASSTAFASHSFKLPVQVISEEQHTPLLRAGYGSIMFLFTLARPCPMAKSVVHH
ncbi:hypothetical protein CISG_02657 [Coccidioides immitis RMSCC 3703]|uniref:Uncharacterized protein n=1 Tax=Coccidioides immitis RMSCC 3703 TaxID=454286 RepID=A0A0J8RA25_COCIT|nr:hypothetical protein CISG_02657 [Coccidioides immitis RMSCC 3703]